MLAVMLQKMADDGLNALLTSITLAEGGIILRERKRRKSGERDHLAELVRLLEREHRHHRPHGPSKVMEGWSPPN